MTRSPDSMSYFARNPCGCAAGVMVDEPQYAADTAKELARYVLAGCTIERIPTAAVGRTHPLKACESNPECVRARKRKSA